MPTKSSLEEQEMDSIPLPPHLAALPYRPCVGLALINQQGHLFAGQRIDNKAEAWQMPQGGIDPGETPLTAALRELGEETGISPDKVVVLRQTGPIPYDLPAELIPRIWGGRYRGQSQIWFALRFLGEDADINIQTAHPEFREWAWMDRATLIKSIVSFKRHSYDQVLTAFADLLT